MTQERKKLGIIGGMGPEATVYFMQRVIALTPAEIDQEHIDMLVSNHASIPDRTAFLRGMSDCSPLPVLTADARMLAESGCKVLAMPCNTSHNFYERLVDSLGDEGDVTFLNIVEESLAQCQAKGAHRVGVLATWGTLLTDLYGRYATERDMNCSYPDPAMQDEVNSLIYDYVKAGKPVPSGMLEGFCDALHENGCDAVILGCTELSVAFWDLPEEVRASYPFVVDSLDALAAACVRECR